MKISFILPSRNNLKYLKWAYNSIRKNQGAHEVEICVADDFSNDGTWEWCQERIKEDLFFAAIRNEGPTRIGHTILYDKLVNEVASFELCMIYHADMYLCPGALDAIEQQMYRKEGNIPISNITDENGNHLYMDYGQLVFPNYKKICSLTRIEPPLHPPGPEKILLNCGTEPEDFKEDYLLEKVNMLIEGGKEAFNNRRGYTTEGIFAPWAFFKKDFQEIGGHDDLFAPQSKEDSDIFNRFQLNGVSFVQTWEGYVYHMTCRGSRFNPSLTVVGRESDEWLLQNQKSTRNFIRKWGHFVKHDRYMKPIIPPKYDIGIVLKGGIPMLRLLEPWCSTIYIRDEYGLIIPEYIKEEQSNTKYSLVDRVKYFNGSESELQNDIIVYVDQETASEETMSIISNLSEIIRGCGELGAFKVADIIIEIRALTEYQHNLIKL